MSYFLHLLVYFDIYVIVALSLNLIVGYCGTLTLAHAAYYAVGAYAYAIFSLRMGLGFLPATALAAGIGGVLSLVISLPAWRLRGDFLVLITLAVQTLLYSVIYNWADPTRPQDFWRNLTNGQYGLAGIPKPTIFGFSCAHPMALALLATTVALLSGFFLWRLQRSPWGRLLVAIRDDELATRSLGKPARLVKMQALAISCALVAVAGALYGARVGYIDPSTASLDEGILMLSMVIIGGVGNFRGPVVGAAVLVLLPELLRFAQFPDALAANLRLAIYGLLLVLMMHFRPQGLSGEYKLN